MVSSTRQGARNQRSCNVSGCATSVKMSINVVSCVVRQWGKEKKKRGARWLIKALAAVETMAAVGLSIEDQSSERATTTCARLLSAPRN